MKRKLTIRVYRDGRIVVAALNHYGAISYSCVEDNWDAVIRLIDFLADETASEWSIHVRYQGVINNV